MSTVEQCPGCRAEIAVGARFCGNCSLELGPACARCQARNPLHFRFCGMCGERFKQAVLRRMEEVMHITEAPSIPGRQ